MSLVTYTHGVAQQHLMERTWAGIEEPWVLLVPVDPALARDLTLAAQRPHVDSEDDIASLKPT